MKVRVSHLPPEGLAVKSELSLENLNARMGEGRHGDDIKFTSAPQVDLVVTKTPQGAETKGRVSARYSQLCGRCDDVVERSLEVEANWVIHRKPDAPHTKTKKHSDPLGQSPDKKTFEKKPSTRPSQDVEVHPEDFEDDVGISFFEGDQFDLESLLQELLILQLDPYWHPTCNSSGECSCCGKVVEVPDEDGQAGTAPLENISLGALLKKAGISNN